MSIQAYFLLLVFISSLVCHECVAKDHCSVASLNRDNFPIGFLFGTSSSSYQYEGAAYEDGKGPSIWDTFVRNYPAKIADNSTGDVAEDQYHRYKEDVSLMKTIGMDAYRMSISWPRLLPRGKLCEGVNPEGVAYYNNLIDELLRNGLTPFVTIFHWDVPQALEDEYNGFLCPRIVNDFRDFAELCFTLFGDRVKNWITLNEPQVFTTMGYTRGTFAPGRCSKWLKADCTGGDSGTEPYKVIKNLLLAHAAAVQVYRKKFQDCQKGQIGITLDCTWTLPYNISDEADRKASSRALAFKYDLYLDPIKSGSWPSVAVKYVGNRLPPFTKNESSMLKESYDFIGINYYTSNYVKDVPCNKKHFSYATDSCTLSTGVRDGIPIGPQAASPWLYIYPPGIYHLLKYTSHKMHNPVIYITENGVDEFNKNEVILNDTVRINYHCNHLHYVLKAIADKVDVRGYFVWTFLDDFEWNSGYTLRFGLVFVDYRNNLARILKASAQWFQSMLNPLGIASM